MNDITSVGKRLQNHEIGPEFDMFTQVIIHVGQITDADGNTKDLDYIAGDTTGRTLEVSDPNGTQEKADALLAKLQNSKFQYQPYRADKALLDPSAELGDGITVSDTFSAIYKRGLTFSSLMAADLEAPSDEEIEHEFPYIPKANREYKREMAFTRSQIMINANGIALEASTARANEQILSSAINVQAGRITQEVSDRKSADSAMSSLIEQTAESIRTEVVKKEDGQRTSFGWNLTASGWKVYSNNKTVLNATKDGLEISGRITATSGYIGNGSSGFEIGNSYIRNGMLELGDTKNNGIYLGTDGIALGAGTFKITKSGKLTATDAEITGKITSSTGKIGGFNITASSIYSGTSSLTSAEKGVFIGAGTSGGIRIYNSAKKKFTFKAGDGTLIISAGLEDMSDTTPQGMYIGNGGISLGGGKFKVTNTGKLTASDVTITGGSISIKDANGDTTFDVTNRGKLTAKSGSIAGFTMSATQLFKATAAPTNGTQYGFTLNSPTSISENTTAIGIWRRKYTNGVAGSIEYPFTVTYGGKLNVRSAISLGSNFNVDANGNVTANNMVLKGELRMQNATGGNEQRINADTLASRASSAYDWTSNNGSYAYEGAGYGYGYNSATQYNASDYPSWFTASALVAKDYFYFGGATCGLNSKTFTDGDGNMVTINYVSWTRYY